ncbi:hypothetical protein BGZ83_010122 [Gryganskiella cystojenkinii]|nr:hypothetical protein BGZ83_010122 [Gryganskiella cystojenkinii]
MPLHQLLEQQEQERLRRSPLFQRQQPCDDQGQSSGNGNGIGSSQHGKNMSDSSFYSSVTSRPSTPSSSQPLYGSGASSSTSPSLSPTAFKNDSMPTIEAFTLPQTVTRDVIDSTTASGQHDGNHNSGGHMVLILSNGTYRYYKNGTPKPGPRWDDECDMTRGEDDTVNYNRFRAIQEEDEGDHGDEGQMAPRLDKGKAVDRSDHGHISMPEGADHSYRKFLQRHDLDRAEFQVEDGWVAEVEGLVVKEATICASPQPFTPVEDPALAGNTDKSGAPTTASEEALSREKSALTRAASTSSYLSPPPRPSPTFGRVQTLGRMLGAKSRPSISYSTMPTLASVTTPTSRSSLTSSAVMSNSTTMTLNSSTSTQMTPYLRHQGSSGSMMTRATTASWNTTGSNNALGTPTTGLSLLDLAQYPTSASSLLLDALAKPMTAAYLQQQKQQQRKRSSHDEGKQRSQSAIFASRSKVPAVAEDNGEGSAHNRAAVLAATRSPSVLLSLSGCPSASAAVSLSGSPLSTPKQWLQSAILQRPGGLRSPSSSPSLGSRSAMAAKTSTLLAAATAAQNLLATKMAEEEMEQELWKALDEAQLYDDDMDGREENDVLEALPSKRRQISISSPSSRKQRPQTRAMSMVELSTSSTIAKASPTTVRKQYKANALTSTSTMVTLESSHGLYQWNEFFDL